MGVKRTEMSVLRSSQRQDDAWDGFRQSSAYSKAQREHIADQGKKYNSAQTVLNQTMVLRCALWILPNLDNKSSEEM